MIIILIIVKTTEKKKIFVYFFNLYASPISQSPAQICTEFANGPFRVLKLTRWVKSDMLLVKNIFSGKKNKLKNVAF